MLIALLAVLGVDLVVIMVLVGVLARRRWVSDQPGAFGGAIRITGGGVVWARAPFLFRNELVEADAAAGAARAAKPGEVRCVGKHAAIVVLAAGGGARIGVAASADGRERACGPVAVGGPVR